MVNFRVGDRVEVVNAGSSSLEDGDIGTITIIEGTSAKIRVNDKGSFGNWVSFEGLKLVPTNSQRIESLEKRVEMVDGIIRDVRSDNYHEIEAMKKEIAELRKVIESYFKLPVEPSTDELEIVEFEGNKYRKVDRLAREGDVVVFSVNDTSSRFSKVNTPYLVIGEIDGRKRFKGENGTHYYVYSNDHKRTPETVDVYELITEDKSTPIKTPNQLRTEIIEKAKGFVEESKRELSCGRGKGYVVPFDGDDVSLGGYICDLDFIVNDKKRTVVALLKWNPSIGDAKIKGRGIAKCNPSDVFNEHIGKAIALGRALGLDVSEFEGAVQPTEVVEGHMVKGSIKGRIVEVTSIEKDGKFTSIDLKPFEYSLVSYVDKIINDTNAIYGEVE